ncbi:hypothetical protein F400_gp115 [Bacillus phage BCD7]|uniref:Uncharacterized protein n=1 Tax=Bacillus phage BCD7 TaxID=1136534 RepID=J9PUE3_9CAUD|nr:hypothetical protein F400_gp115 [Bacillus phage BCD7]AEZ50562.1 hypothetical protein BCD7_0115 [Bacillus phage BCD7]
MQAVGKLRQSVINSGDGETVFLQFEDVLSGLVIAEIEMDFEAFGKMLAQNGTVSVEYKLYTGSTDKLGKKAVLNKVNIPIEMEHKYGDDRQPHFKQQIVDSDEYNNMTLGGWEVNCWEYNMRHHRSDGLYPVAFIKYVEVND